MPPSAIVDMSDDEDQDLLELLRQHLGLNGAKTNGPPDTGILRDAQFIYDNSIDVAIDMLGTRSAAKVVYEQMNKRNYSMKTWTAHELHAKIIAENRWVNMTAGSTYPIETNDPSRKDDVASVNDEAKIPASDAEIEQERTQSQLPEVRLDAIVLSDESQTAAKTL